MNTTKDLSPIKKIITLPEFDQVIWFSNCEFSILKKYIRNSFKEQISNETNNVALTFNFEYKNLILIWIDKDVCEKDFLRFLVHESVHAANFVKDNTCITANDEFDACITSFIVSKILDK
ncbi:MAG: hypothetical protein J6C46_07625 [Clostridia bacterium]|nr:hypothetical protein [Clostridia bacterium]